MEEAVLDSTKSIIVMLLVVFAVIAFTLFVLFPGIGDSILKAFGIIGV